MKQTIVILCPHRSGSSAFAGLLHTMGIHMGDNLVNSSPDNPKGHFEDYDFVQFGTKFLTLRGGAWDVPPSIKSMSEMLPAEKKEFKALITRKKKTHDLWGWKDPRTVLYISHVWEMVPYPVFIWMERNEANCVKSINERAKRMGQKPVKSQLYAIHRFMLDRFIETSGQLVTRVRYEDLIENTRQYIHVIAKKWNLPITKEALEFINPRLCHWRENGTKS